MRDFNQVVKDTYEEVLQGLTTEGLKGMRLAIRSAIIGIYVEFEDKDKEKAKQ